MAIAQQVHTPLAFFLLLCVLLSEFRKIPKAECVCVCVCVRLLRGQLELENLSAGTGRGSGGDVCMVPASSCFFFSERATMATCTWLQPLFWLFQYLLVGIFGWTFSFLFIYALTIQGPAKLQDLLDNLLLSRRNGKCHYMLTGCWQQGSL